MKKWYGIVFIWLNGLVQTGLAQDWQKWEKEIAAFEQQDKKTKPPLMPIVFTGSSSIRLWESLAHDFPGKPVLNRGFGGSQTFEVVHFADRLITLYKPKQVIIYTGDNDLADGKSPDQVLADFKVLFQKIRKDNSHVNVQFISIKPSPSRKQFLTSIVLTNTLIRNYLKTQTRTGYIDIYSRMLTPEGKFNPVLYKADSLHMTDAGYQIWAKAVRPVLK